MRRLICSVVAIAWAAVAVGAADDKPKPAESPPKTVAALKKESEEAERELYKVYEAFTEAEKKDGKKVNELFNGHEKAQAKRYEAALEVAKADPKAEAAFEAVEWLLTNPRAYYLPVGKPAIELATEHFAASPQIGNAVLMLGRYGAQPGSPIGKATEEFLKTVSEKNTEKGVLGVVAIVKAWNTKAKYDGAEYRKAKDANELAAAAEKAFELAAKEFGDVKLPGRGESKSIADAAKIELFELRNLRVGKTAPDIEGEDLDGKKFKLSDYKGKVVVLDFWGDW